MSIYTFRKLDRANPMPTLRNMFKVLHENMSIIAPTGNSYQEDEAFWLSYITAKLQDPYPDFILLYVNNEFAGYFQYEIQGNTVLIDEVEITKKYQRTKLFYHLCLYLLNELPSSTDFIESYVRKENANSLKINRKLGMQIIGENRSGRSYHLRGEASKIRQVLVNISCQNSYKRSGE